MKNPAAVLDEAAQEWLDCYDAHRKFIAATMPHLVRSPALFPLCPSPPFTDSSTSSSIL